MEILALTDRLNPMGIFCIASLLWLFIVLLAHQTGWIGGGFICFILFFVALFATSDHRASPNSKHIGWIGNWSQSKLLNMKDVYISDPDHLRVFSADSQNLRAERFVPKKELKTVDGHIVMKWSGESPKNYVICDDFPDEFGLGGTWDTSKEQYESYLSWCKPDNLLYKNNAGVWVNGKTHKPPTDDDFYLPLIVLDDLNIPKEHGGKWGIPQWVYHPASSLYIFALGAAPLIGIGAALKG